MSFNSILQIKILAKISEFIVKSDSEEKQESPEDPKIAHLSFTNNLKQECVWSL